MYTDEVIPRSTETSTFKGALQPPGRTSEPRKPYRTESGHSFPLHDKDLNMLVPFTGRLLCAMRAADALLASGPSLIDDPLARYFAGEEALSFVCEKMTDYHSRCAYGGLLEGVSPSTSSKNHSSNSKNSVRSYGAVRARLIDDRIRAILRSWQDPTPADSGLGIDRPALQVVCVGAGMDTRPWRLTGAEGVRWFDVDFAEVLDLKKGLLQQVDAQVGSGSNDAKGWKYPLKVHSWTPVAADLLEADAERLLTNAGLVPGLHTVWVAEGLLMYLHPSAGLRLLEGARKLSAPGSMLLATHVTGPWLNAMKRVARGGKLTGDEAQELACWINLNDQDSLPTVSSIAQAMRSEANQAFGDPQALEAAGWRLTGPPESTTELGVKELGVHSMFISTVANRTFELLHTAVCL